MPHHVIKLLKDALNEGNKQLDSSVILILGISYKPNVKDIQLSPAQVIISELQKMGAEIRIFDPYFKNASVYGIQTANNLDEVISNVDATILVTSHNEFQNIQPEYFISKMKSPILIDTRGVIDVKKAQKAGLIFRGLGRGKF